MKRKVWIVTCMLEHEMVVKQSSARAYRFPRDSWNRIWHSCASDWGDDWSFCRKECMLSAFLLSLPRRGPRFLHLAAILMHERLEDICL